MTLHHVRSPPFADIRSVSFRRSIAQTFVDGFEVIAVLVSGHPSFLASWWIRFTAY